MWMGQNKIISITPIYSENLPKISFSRKFSLYKNSIFHSPITHLVITNYQIQINRIFSTGKDKRREVSPEVAEKKAAKKELIKKLLAEQGRKKPVRRSLWSSEMKKKQKLEPLPASSILLYRSSSELDKVDEMYGRVLKLEKSPYPDPYYEKRIEYYTAKRKKWDEEKQENEEPKPPRKRPPPRITIYELKELLDSEHPPIVIDVRDFLAHENEPSIPRSLFFSVARFNKKRPKPIHERAHFINDAIKLSFPQFKIRYKVSPPRTHQPIVIYSNLGIRSEEVALYAIEKGFKDVKSLVGGARLWNKYY